MPSETDEPLAAFSWSGSSDLDLAALLCAQGIDPTAGVEVQSAREFLGPFAEQQAWFEDSDRAEATRFAALISYLESHLTDVQVYRVGSGTILVLIMGRMSTGEWVGLRTKVVET